MIDSRSKIYVAGHRGLVGSAITYKLIENGFTNLILKTHKELDLTCQKEVNDFFAGQRPDYVILAAAKVGGIAANDTFPAEFIYENIEIQSHVIHASWNTGVKRLIFLGSSCIYPRLAPQPLKEEYLLTGPLEPTNEPYAVAKIAGIKMCEAYNRQYNTRFFALMPTNLYGPNDNFDPYTSHVIPALIRKIHDAKTSGSKKVVLWGTGKPRREFLHVHDMAQAAIFILNLDDEKFDQLISEYRPPLINIGCGHDISIEDLANMIKDIVGFNGEIVFDPSMPDGTPRKLLDISKITKLGWKPKIPLEQGIKETYEWCLENNIF